MQPLVNRICFFVICSQVPYKCNISAELESDLVSIPVATVSLSGQKVVSAKIVITIELINII